MYSPLIDPEIVQVLYKLRRHRKIPMTRLAHQLLLKALASEQLPDEVKAMVPGIGGAKKRKQTAA